MHKLLISLPLAHFQALQALAKASGDSVGSLIRRAIAQYLQQAPPP